MEIVGYILIFLLLANILIAIFKKSKINLTEFGTFESNIKLLEQRVQDFEVRQKEEFKNNREESASTAKENRTELNNSLKELKEEVSKTFKEIADQNKASLEQINNTLDQKIEKMLKKSEENNVSIRETITKTIKEFQESFDKNVESFNNLQREKFGQLEEKQTKLVESTEKKLEEMRATVEEKLQKTLNERIGQSFETVGKQLQAVQEGLGEMKNLANDVGGLKKVLSNVKHRGGLGEIQLEMLLEQILAPDQYEANAHTKIGSSDSVEFAVKLPGRDDIQSTVYLPIDAKFPKDIYEQLVDAYDSAEPIAIEAANKNIESVIKKMAKDIRDKYIDPPNTTDFAIMFLPFEGIYAEVIRRSSLLEVLHREFKIIVTGPTTLAAILNSLQMGFRTLALQKRSSEVWTILGAVKTEFEKFGGLLEKAQKQIYSAGETIEILQGTRTRAINRKLKEVEALPSNESAAILPEIASGEIVDTDEEYSE
jgi:DNA recombination protein RmuC